MWIVVPGRQQFQCPRYPRILAAPAVRLPAVMSKKRSAASKQFREMVSKIGDMGISSGHQQD